MRISSDPDEYHGWISDPDLSWFNAWLPEGPVTPFPEWLEWIQEHVPNLGEISEFRVRRGPDPQMWMFQVGYRIDEPGPSTDKAETDSVIPTKDSPSD